MQDLWVWHLLGIALLAGVVGILVFRGAIAHKVVHTKFSEVFCWNRLQQTGGGTVCGLLAGCLVILPYAFDASRLQSYFDLILAVAMTAVCCVGVLEALNRRVAMNETCVGGVTWTGSVKQAEWGGVTEVTFHDFYGGFFNIRGVGTTIFVPVQIDRPLHALALLEKNTPSAALKSAKRGLAICRAVLDP